MIHFEYELDEEQEKFVREILSPDKLVIFCNSAAGTGKTTIAMGAANILVQDKRNAYDGIVYVVSPYGEQKQGYLRGDLKEKSEVYFEPAYQAMDENGLRPGSDISHESLSSKKYEKGFVKPLTHTFMRGINVKKKIVIIDEAQNYTASDLKKVLTRIHDSCKVIVIGHTGQVDISGKSGFADYIEHFLTESYSTVCNLTINHRGKISNHADKLKV